MIEDSNDDSIFEPSSKLTSNDNFNLENDLSRRPREKCCIWIKNKFSKKLEIIFKLRNKNKIKKKQISVERADTKRRDIYDTVMLCITAVLRVYPFKIFQVEIWMFWYYNVSSISCVWREYSMLYINMLR